MFKKLIAMASSAMNDPYILGAVGLFALTKSLQLLMDQAQVVQKELQTIQAQAAATFQGVQPQPAPTTDPVPPVDVEEPSEEAAK